MKQKKKITKKLHSQTCSQSFILNIYAHTQIQIRTHTVTFNKSKYEQNYKKKFEITIQIIKIEINIHYADIRA